jgi:hypothetical protein
MIYDMVDYTLPAASCAASSTISSSRLRHHHPDGHQLLHCWMNPAVHARLRPGYRCEPLLPGQLGSLALPPTHARP